MGTSFQAKALYNGLCQSYLGLWFFTPLDKAVSTITLNLGSAFRC
jgi:hypothetical protein